MTMTSEAQHDEHMSLAKHIVGQKIVAFDWVNFVFTLKDGTRFTVRCDASHNWGEQDVSASDDLWLERL